LELWVLHGGATGLEGEVIVIRLSTCLTRLLSWWRSG
jgi:hypothetical protein